MRVTIRHGDREAVLDDPAAGVLDLPRVVELLTTAVQQPGTVGHNTLDALVERTYDPTPGTSPRLPLGFRP